MAKNFYAVAKGKKPGIYRTWKECEEQVHGVNALFHGFSTYEEAVDFMAQNDAIEYAQAPECGSKIDVKSHQLENKMISQGISNRPYAFVDGSFNASAGVYGYGGFLVVGKEKYVLQDSGSNLGMAAMRNVAGEILGSMAAMIKAYELGLKELDIYYDYTGIANWANGSWQTNKPETKAYADFCKEIRTKMDVRFVKVKGHSGVDGNEEADRLAKQAVGII